MVCPVGETKTLEQLAALVEKSGKRFRNAVQREAETQDYERQRNDPKQFLYTLEYHELAKRVEGYRANKAPSSEYQASSLKEYAKRAWRLALELQETACPCGALGQERRHCEGCGADEMCEVCFYDHRCALG